MELLTQYSPYIINVFCEKLFFPLCQPKAYGKIYKVDLLSTENGREDRRSKYLLKAFLHE